MASFTCINTDIFVVVNTLSSPVSICALSLTRVDYYLLPREIHQMESFDTSPARVAE